MDKSKWVYKKLGEVCEIVTGSTPKTNVPSYWGGSNYWVTPAELDDRVYIDKTERTLTDEALSHSKLTLMPVGTVLLSSRAPIGKVAITKVPMYCNQGFKNLICSDAIYNKYLYWFLKINTTYLNSLGRGATFKEISKSIVANIKISFPPLSTQHQIVSELDQLSDIISLKQQQIKEYDALAQALFCEMFENNDKHWEQRQWNDALEIINGRDYKLVIDSNGTYPIYGSGGIMGYANAFLCPENTVVIGRKGNINKPLFVSQKFWNIDTAFGLVANKDVLNPIYLYFFCLNYNFEKHNKAVTIPSLTKRDLLKISIPLPPLTLQHSFAEKVQAIEHQKQLLKRSIAETQTLLDSRMQEYFG